MDTVPPFFPARITSEKIFGRGAIDNKGNIAGAIIAARQLQNINLLFTVGEEKNSDGAKKANIKGKVIILEPMNFEVRTAQCGVVAVRLVTKGDQKHSSLLTKKSENAIHVLVEILECLSKKNWHCFNVGMIKGGVAPNIVAGSAEAEFSVRPKSRKEFEEILETIKALKVVKKVIINKMPPFRSSFSEKNISPEPVSFFSELSCFKNGLLWGVGDIAQAHTLTEFIRRNDLRKLPDKLIALIKSLEIA
jgi:acetylornithine deacetylase/succinyl-diaminopimelate desuccinylase-like protein